MHNNIEFERILTCIITVFKNECELHSFFLYENEYVIRFIADKKNHMTSLKPQMIMA